MKEYLLNSREILSQEMFLQDAVRGKSTTGITWILEGSWSVMKENLLKSGKRKLCWGICSEEKVRKIYMDSGRELIGYES